MRGIGTAAVCLMFGCTIGTGAALAQSAGGRSGGKTPFVKTSTVKTLLRHKAGLAGKAQPPMFPNARVTRTKPFATCSRFGRRLWSCAWHVAIYEDSLLDPPQYETRKSTVRFCQLPEDTPAVRIRQATGSDLLRIIGGWKMTCALHDREIAIWNDFGYGPDYSPDAVEPVPYEERPAFDIAAARDDLAAAPEGAPGLAPPGPLTTFAGAPNSRMARAAYDDFQGCSPWVHHPDDARYWIYYCFWRARPLLGASLGIFNTVTFYEAYYWTGNDANGRPMARLFESGTFGPPAGSAFR
jgi:hypothetical protein